MTKLNENSIKKTLIFKNKTIKIMENAIILKVTVEYTIKNAIDIDSFKNEFNNDPYELYKYISNEFKDDPTNFSSDAKIVMIKAEDNNSHKLNNNEQNLCAINSNKKNEGYVVKMHRNGNIIVNLFFTHDLDKAASFCTRYNKLLKKLKTFYLSRLYERKITSKDYSTLYFKYVRIEDIIGASFEPIDVKLD